MKNQKKKLGISLLSLCFAMTTSLFCFVGCTQSFSPQSHFSEENITVRVGDSFDVEDYFVSSSATDFSSSNENVLKREGNKFFALQEGRAAIKATYEGMLVDTLDVLVAYSFNSPTNLVVTNDGVVSWDGGGIFVDGQKIDPDTYTLKITLNGQESYQTAYDTFFVLSEPGEYEVCVKSDGQGDILESDWCKNSITFSFDQVQGASEFAFVADQEFGAQTGKFSWQGEGQGNLNVDGIDFVLNETQKEWNFASYPENSTIQANLSLTSEGKTSTSARVSVTKLASTEMSFEGNELRWQPGEGEQKRLLNVSKAGADQKSCIEAKNSSSVLEGLGEGIYTFDYQAVGGVNTANGNVKSFPVAVGKIKNVSAQTFVDGDQVTVTFSTDSQFNRDFVVWQNDEPGKRFSFQEGQNSLTVSFSLVKGENVFYVQALPTNVSQFEVDGIRTSNVLKSDNEKLFTIYNVEDIVSLTHSLEGENSILSFQQVKNANLFKVKINDVEAGEFDLDRVQTEGGISSINIGKITSQAYGGEGRFEVVLTATRVGEDVDTVSPSQATKILELLSAPSKQEKLQGKQILQNYYSWEHILDGESQVAKYAYKLAKTSSSAYDDSEMQLEEIETEENKTSTFDAGFYKIYVRAIPLSQAQDKFLPSEEVLTDTFFFSEKLASPLVRFDSPEDVELLQKAEGYVLSIRQVEHANTYQIYINGQAEGLPIFKSDQSDILYYDFAQTQLFDEDGKLYKIEIRAFAEEGDMQLIFTQSEPSVLNVTRLSSPSLFEVSQDRNVLTIKNSVPLSVLQILKDGATIANSEIGQDASVQIDGYDGRFEISALNSGFYEFFDFVTNGSLSLPSKAKTFVFQRSKTPEQLNYSNGQVSFSHSGETAKAERYYVTISIKMLNGIAPPSQTFEIESGVTTFDLEEKIALLRAQNKEFESAYMTQKEIVLSLWADISRQEADAYYLPSRLATVLHNPLSTQLTIKKLDRVSLGYDESTKTIYWQGVSDENPQYVVYFNDEQVGTVSSPSINGRYEFDISDSVKYDFSKAGDYRFYVVAHSDNALDSEKSQQIVFHKLSPIESLQVFEREGKYYALVSLSSEELDHITQLKVNGKNVLEGIELVPSTFEIELSEQSLLIGTSGKNFVADNGDIVFYISSEITSFEIKQLQKGSFDSRLSAQDGFISWQDFSQSEQANDWLSVLPTNPLRYAIEVYANDKNFKIFGIDATTLSLKDPRILEAAAALQSQTYSIRLFAYAGSYTISNGGHAYYGEVMLQEGKEIKKLDEVSDLQASVDSQAPESIFAERAKDVVLKWQYNDEQTYFEIYVDGEMIGQTQKGEKTYSLKQSLFKKASTLVEVFAMDGANLRSEAAKIWIEQYSAPSVTINDRGTVEISAEQMPAQNGFVVEILIGSENKTFVVSGTTFELNSPQYLGSFENQSGVLSINVVHKANNAVVTDQGTTVAIPSVENGSCTGRVLPKPTFLQETAGLRFLNIESGSVLHIERYNDEGEQDFVQLLEDGETFFAYPEEWGEGHYNLLLYMTKGGNVDSYKGEKTLVDIVRISNAESLSFTRIDDGLDYEISWQEVPQALQYMIEIYSNGELIKSTSVTDTKISLSQLREKVDGLGGGKYEIHFFTMPSEGLSNTNSTVLKFNLTIANNTISSIKEGEIGQVVFDAQENHYGYHAVVQNEGTGERKSFDLQPDQRGVLIDENGKSNFSGQTRVFLVELAQSAEERTWSTLNGDIVLDGEVQEFSIYKLVDIVSVEKVEDKGILRVEVEDETLKGDRLFYAKLEIETDGIRQTYLKKVPTTKISNTTYQINALEMCNLFTEIKPGEQNFALFSYIAGNLRSDEETISFDFAYEKRNITADKASEIEDYLLIDEDYDSEQNQIQKIFFRAKQEKGDWQYFDIDVQKAKGWWVTIKNEESKTKTFVGSIDGLTNVESQTKCYAINVTQVLSEMPAGNVYVQVGYIQKNFKVVNYCQSFKYEVLEGPNSLTVEDGNLKWASSSGKNSGYAVFFEDDEGVDITYLNAADATYIKGEDIKKSGDFKVAIQAVSSSLQILPSKKVYYQTEEEPILVHKLGEVHSSLSLENGVLSIDYAVSDLEKGNSVESILKQDFASPKARVTALMTNRLAMPFDYKAANFANVSFKLRFVSKQGTQQKFETSVKAINILKALSAETMQSLNNLSGSYVGDYASELQVFVALLNDQNNFGGVASDKLLFDTIGIEKAGKNGIVSGENIPAGVYDIYIQNEGDNESLSSSFLLALSNKEVLPSPVVDTVQTDKDKEKGTSNYYLRFVPVKNSKGEMLLNYTLFLTSDSTVLTSKNTIKYKIRYDEETRQWLRSSFSAQGGEISLGETQYDFETDSEGFVVISINDEETGLMFEDNIKSISGDSVSMLGKIYMAKLLADGDNEMINGKNENVQIIFLNFDATGLSLDMGSFRWSNFNSAGRYFPTTIYYQKEGSVTREQVVTGGSYASWTPVDPTGGNYTFIRFVTKGYVRAFEICIDSPVYTINNVYKLPAPYMGVENGKMVIKEKPCEFDLRQTKGFLLSNDRSGYTLQLEAENKDGVFQIVRATGVNSESKNSSNYAFLADEENARNHYAQVTGHSFDKGQTRCEGNDRDGYNIIIELEDGNQKVLLQSDRSVLIAEKIVKSSETKKAEDQKMRIENGILMWEDWQSEKAKTQEGENVLAANQKIVYQIDVEYYSPTFDPTASVDKIDYKKTETFYTDVNSFDTTLIKDDVYEAEYKYVLNVKAIVCLTVPTLLGEIKTINGKSYFVLDDATSQYNSPSDTYILEGTQQRLGVDDLNEATSEVALERTGVVTNFALNYGVLQWNNNNDEGNVVDVFKIESMLSGDRATKLDGKVQAISSTLGTEQKFVPNVENSTQLSQGSTYRFSIVVYEAKNKLKSKETFLLANGKQVEVRVLPMIETTDYTANVDANGKHEIDFNNYFDFNRNIVTPTNVNILKSSQVMEDSTFEKGEQDTLLTNSSTKFKLDGGETLYFVPRPAERTAALIRPYAPTKIVFNETQISENDFYFFDDTTNTFHWTFNVDKKLEANKQAQVFADANGTPISLEAGEIVNAEEPNQRFYPIKIEGSIGFYVETSQTNVDWDEETQTMRVYARGEEDVPVYRNSATNPELTQEVLQSGSSFELDLKHWSVENQTGFAFEAQTLFVKVNAIRVENGIAYARNKSPQDENMLELFVDENLENHITIEKGTVLLPNKDHISSALLESVSFDEGGGNVDAYVLKEDIDESLVQNGDNDYDDITFKVVITTEYDYRDNSNNIIRETSTRTYENIPIGPTTFGSLGGTEIDAAGIRVTSFVPSVMGEVTKFEVRARKGENNLLSTAYSDLSTNSRHNVNLFRQGIGTQENPYLISSSQQFENIKYRLQKESYQTSFHERIVTTKTTQASSSTTTTTEGDKIEEDVFYFRQEQNIEVEFAGFVSDGSFNGIYDGGSKKLGITILGTTKIDTPISATMLVGDNENTISTYSFANCGAVFRQLGSKGVIQNLKVNLNLDHDSNFKQSLYAGSGTLVGGLVLENRGKIESIEIVQASDGIKIDEDLYAGNNNTMVVAPVVGINYARMEDICNKNPDERRPSAIKIKRTSSSANQRFYYAGIVGFNAAGGNIVFAQNLRDITVDFKNNSSGAVCVCGIMIGQSGTTANIEASLNQGKISAANEGTNAVSMAAGIGYCFMSTKINACVNTGTIVAQHAGGIAFYMNSASTFGSLVALGNVELTNKTSTTKYVNLIASSISKARATAANYSYEGYAPSNWRCQTAPSSELTLTSPNGRYEIVFNLSGALIRKKS